MSGAPCIGPWIRTEAAPGGHLSDNRASAGSPVYGRHYRNSVDVRRAVMTTMLAMVVPGPGAKLRAEERELPEPGPDEVRIRVQACGVCHSDALTIAGRMPGLGYPRVPGHEVIGV